MQDAAPRQMYVCFRANPVSVVFVGTLKYARRKTDPNKNSLLKSLPKNMVRTTLAVRNATRPTHSAKTS